MPNAALAGVGLSYYSVEQIFAKWKWSKRKSNGVFDVAAIREQFPIFEASDWWKSIDLPRQCGNDQKPQCVDRDAIGWLLIRDM